MLQPTDTSFVADIRYGPSRELQVTAVPKVVSITNTRFEQNYAGQRASGANVESIQTSNVSLSNIIITNSTGAFSFFESEHQLPFLGLLTMGRYKLNFFNMSKDGQCQDEISSFGYS